MSVTSNTLFMSIDGSICIDYISEALTHSYTPIVTLRSVYAIDHFLLHNANTIIGLF